MQIDKHSLEGSPVGQTQTAAWDLTDLDFSQCEAETLDRTGLIQANGAVLILDYPSLRPQACSANWNSLTEAPVRSFGEPFALAELLAPGQDPASWDAEARVVQTARKDAGRFSQLIAKRWENRLQFEWLQLTSPAQDETFTRPAFESLNYYEAGQRVSDYLRESLGLDRVMIYKFDKDHAGDVIAESRRSDWEPYIGLHYPATDIPQIARQLYLSCRLRCIHDTTLASVPLLTAAGLRPDAIDLTPCSLRSVSPYHLEYLRNMGVRATVSAAIVVEGQLWGLIACHHGAPLVLSLAQQNHLQACAEHFAAILTQGRREEAAGLAQILAETNAAMRHVLQDQPHLSDAQILEHLLLGPYGLSSLTKSQAAVIYADGQLVGSGNHPNLDWIEKFVSEFLGQQPEGRFCSEHLSADCPLPQPEGASWSGMLAETVCQQPTVVLMTFRQPFLKEVHWGGDPGTPALRAQSGRLSPRRSFHLWKETIVDHSKPWLTLEIHFIEQVGSLLREVFAPAELCGRIQRGSRALSLQMVEHAYIARAATSGGQHGLMMTTVETRDQPATLLQLNQNLLDLFEVTPARWAPGDEVSPFLTRLGLIEEGSSLASMPDQMTIWSPVLGHRSLKVSRQGLLSVETSQGRHAVVSLQFSDMTGETRLLEALRSALERAESASEAKTRFLANTSHELKTPLHAILGFQGLLAQELESSSADPAELKLYSQHIELASRHMLNLVEQLLFFTRSSRGGLRLPVQELDLRTLVRESLDWQSYAASQKQIELRAEMPEHEVRGEFNAQTVQQLLINLLSNAIKFTRAGGQVVCSLSIDALSGQCELSVADQGVGMSEYEQQHAFEPFFQGEPFGTKAEGAGIGLSLVKAIAEAHGGRVELQSAPAEGTRVTVWLPLKQPAGEIEILAAGPRS